MTLDWLTARPIANRGLHNRDEKIFANTLPAFELAAQFNYNILCDVQLSRDGVPMIFHDKTLEKTAHIDKRIIDLRSADIANLPILNDATPILSLATLLNKIQGKVGLLLNLIGNENLDSGFIATVTELTAKYPNNIALMSKDIHILRRFEIVCQNIPHGILAKGTQRKDIEQHFSMLAHRINFVTYNHNDLFNPFVRFAKNTLHIPVLARTIRHNDEWQKAKTFTDQMIFEGFNPDQNHIENHRPLFETHGSEQI